MSYKTRPNEPLIDETLHLSKDEMACIINAYQTMRKADSTSLVSFLVQRNSDGSRNTPDKIFADIEKGVVGDRWFLKKNRDRKEQIAVMNIHIAQSIANGQSLTLFGDSFFIDFDVSPQNMPVGTKIQIGDAVMEITSEPHVPCLKFKKRFGNPSFTLCAKEKQKCFRGIYLQVIQSGDVWVGASIVKL
jgi:hypothetical protein